MNVASDCSCEVGAEITLATCRARIRIIESGYLGQVYIPHGGLVMYLKPDSRPQNLSTWTRAAGVITCDE